MSGELLAVRLLVPHNGKEAGELVLVDRLRAAKMEEVGIGSIEPPATVQRDEIVDGWRVQYTAEAHTIPPGTYTREELTDAVEAAIKAPRVPPADKMARPKKTKAE